MYWHVADGCSAVTKRRPPSEEDRLAEAMNGWRLLKWAAVIVIGLAVGLWVAYGKDRMPGLLAELFSK